MYAEFFNIWLLCYNFHEYIYLYIPFIFKFVQILWQVYDITGKELFLPEKFKKETFQLLNLNRNFLQSKDNKQSCNADKFVIPILRKMFQSFH